MRKKKQEDPRWDESTREKLINSALELFLEKGYAKTTLEDIVRNVGLTRGAFYWNFKEKKDLLLEIEKRYSSIIRHLFEIEQLPSAYESLKQMIIRYLDERINRPSIFLYFIRYRVEAETELKDLIREQRELDISVLREISDLLSRGVESGELNPDIDVNQQAFFIYTYLVGIGTLATTHMGEKKHFDFSGIQNDFEAYAQFLLRDIKKR